MGLPPDVLWALSEDEKSIDPEDVRDELKTESIMLNGALKDLNKNYDFWEVVRPLLADQGFVC
jgi:hypothetical protein